MSRGDQTSLKVKLLMLCMAVGYLLTVAMTVSPELHHWVHHDSDEAGHHCVVTALADGQVDSPNVAPMVSFVPVVTGAVAVPVGPGAREIFLAGFVLEHAPPVG